jgi:threonine aldolase
VSPIRPIDLRSDTVTRPTPEMRRVMAAAEVGDDLFGEDPSVLALEATVAGLLGMEAAVFVPSGTMANQLAVGLHCRPGDEVLAHADSHLIHNETGGLSALWGAHAFPLSGPRGHLRPEQLAPAMRGKAEWLPVTRMLWLENTHNRGGGSVWPPEQLAAVIAEGRRLGLAVHLDGARLFNAQIACGRSVASLASGADTMSVCFSKGLGAPVGSALCGGREAIAVARRLRKRLGGSMRQAGILAAAASYALQHHVERLAEDHRHARLLAQGLQELPGVEVELSSVETNMVFARFERPASEICRELAAQGVHATPASEHEVRFVLHLDVSAEDVAAAIVRAQRVLQGTV